MSPAWQAWLWIIIPAGYLFIGYLLGCVAVRIEWQTTKSPDNYGMKERYSTARVIRLMWPLAFPVFMACEFPKYLDKKRRALPITDYLSTPRAIRKQQKVNQ